MLDETLVCPWWAGGLLASPLRKLLHDPHRLLSPFVKAGMRVLEPGPGMGFFTLELAGLCGPGGRVFAVDLQPQMLEGLKRRAARAGLEERIECRLAAPESMGLGDLKNSIDFALAFAMVHEVARQELFLEEMSSALKPGASILFAEPRIHVSGAQFDRTIQQAAAAGFKAAEGPLVRLCRSALLIKA